MSGKDENRVVDRPSVSPQRHAVTDGVLDIEPAFARVAFEDQSAALNRAFRGMQVRADRRPAVIVAGKNFQLAGRVVVVGVLNANGDDILEENRLPKSIETRPGPGVNTGQVVHIEDSLVAVLGQCSRVLPGTVGLVHTHAIRKVGRVVEVRMGGTRHASVIQRVLDGRRELGNDLRT